MQKFLSKIDFEKLKEQKKDLQETLAMLERMKLSRKEGSLQGLLRLIDTIQDIAVDEHGYNEEEVFEFEKE